ncbi:siderophore-interacting protein [Halarcobacter mediterraneus]|uniref:Siderophore-interacting protein n=1 Tax=Halarcobacter mediterraneus TaxID=2023153 RepID=A0A4V1M1D3_9BACT|nr:FecR domain-containing protein [Halarcobacter mediterraneus]RXK13264.1 siderophore-interacting protein [Halarcobacter mediterraneus]
MKDNVQDTAIKWLTCEKEGLTKEQKKEFYSWLEADISHKEAYDDAKNIYSLFQNMPKEYSKELSKKAHEGARRTKLIENFKPIISYAAVVMLIIVAFFNSYNYFIPSFEQTLVSENKNISKKLLPDGSIVSLDIKTKMQIEYYKNKRVVSLSTGQAMFDVAKDKKRPFIIDSGKTRIEVLGTKFEVINLNDSTTIKVEEGVVKVGHIFNKNKEAQVIGLLKKGQEIQINNLGKVLNSGKTSISEIAPWRNKELIFNKTTIKEALNKFARYEDIQFSFKNSNIQNKLFSGKFYTYDLDKFLNSLEKIYPIKIKKEENRVFIYKD